jgi:Tfp pilus assembly protein PilN
MRAVNLIPAEQRSGAGLGVGSSEGAAYAVMALVAGIAVLAFLYGRANHQISSNRSKSVTLMAQAQRAQAESSRLAPYTSFSALRQQRIQAVSELVDSRFDWAHVFHEFGRVLPPQVSVSSLTGTIGGAPAASPSAAAPAPGAAAPTSSASASSTPTTPSATPAASAVTSATPPGSVPSFSLTGCATSQPAVALMLNRLRLIDGVDSVTLQSSTKSSLGAGTPGGGGCVGGEPAYTVQIAFEALPAPSAIRSTTAPVASTATSAPAGGAR